MATKPSLRELLDAKIAFDHLDRMRIEQLRRKAVEHTHVHDIFFPPRPRFTQTAGHQWLEEPPKDWTFELEMVQHALVSRDRAVVYVPQAATGWNPHTILVRAFEARFGSPAYVNHGLPVGWSNGRCLYVPIELDHLVRISVPRVVRQDTDTRAWPRVVVFAHTDDEHFRVEDLP